MTRNLTYSRSSYFGLFVVALITVALLATSIPPAQASREGRRNTALAIIGGLALLSILADNDNDHYRHHSYNYRHYRHHRRGHYPRYEHRYDDHRRSRHRSHRYDRHYRHYDRYNRYRSW